MYAIQLTLVLLLCLATPSMAALVPEVEKAGEELVSALKDEMKAMAGDEDAMNLQAIRQYLRQVQNALGQDSNRQLDQWLENFGNYQPTPKVLGCLDALKKSIKDGFNQKTRAVAAELEGLLAAAAEKVARAEEPADLDKVLGSLSRNRFNNGGDGRFLARAMEDATRRDDLAACLRIGDLRQLLVRSANYSDKDLDALRSYVAGRNQAEAGQYLLAVVSLQTALKSGSELVPAATTGALLETIRKDHP